VALGDWYPVLLITLFNIADLLGKNLPFGRCQLSQQQLLGLSVLRLGFLPLFVGATLAQAPAPVIALLTFALGLSNG
jgi:equilibrative nucleoside transporter 1/2/3